MQKIVPQLKGASGQTRDEVFLECGNDTFGSIDAVVVRRDKINVHLVGFDAGFYHL